MVHQPPNGGAVYNTYRRQLDAAGRQALSGLMSVGDAVCTTTPLAGRGMTLALMQARELARVLDLHDGDIATATMQFTAGARTMSDRGSTTTATSNADRVRRWSGGDVDVSRRLASDLIVAAAKAALS